MSQNYIKVDKQGLEDTFCLVKSVEFSPIYEYVNGEKPKISKDIKFRYSLLKEFMLVKI